MKRSRVWPIIGIVCGSLGCLVGLSLIGMYLYSAVLEPLGEPDQSLLFWLFPFLLIGTSVLIAGIVALVAGVLTLRRNAPEGEHH